MESRVPQEGVSAFGHPIIPLGKIARESRVASYLQDSFLLQFAKTGLDEGIIQRTITECLEAAKTTPSILAYERTAYSLLEKAGILPGFTRLTSDRAQTMAETVRPYLKGKTILDLGCGPGKVSELLSRDGYEVSLADVYKNDYVTEKLSSLSFTLLEQDAPLPFPDASFDNVLVFAMLHHTTNPISLLREIYRILKPSGRLHLIETVFGIEIQETKDPIARKFASLSHEEQRQATMFLDYFGNHVTWYFTTELSHLVPVPFNFNTPTEWEKTFKELGYGTKEKKSLGIDPNSGVYHVFFSLEK